MPARVTAVAYFRVVDPNKPIVEIQDVLAATSQTAQTTLRSVLGKAELDTLLSEGALIRSSVPISITRSARTRPGSTPLIVSGSTFCRTSRQCSPACCC